MKPSAPSHPLRYVERPDDDLPNVPYPWQPPASGQAARADRQQLADLEVNRGRD
jgi:hypothetical protein